MIQIRKLYLFALFINLYYIYFLIPFYWNIQTRQIFFSCLMIIKNVFDIDLIPFIFLCTILWILFLFPFNMYVVHSLSYDYLSIGAQGYITKRIRFVSIFAVLPLQIQWSCPRIFFNEIWTDRRTETIWCKNYCTWHGIVNQFPREIGYCNVIIKKKKITQEVLSIALIKLSYTFLLFDYWI